MTQTITVEGMTCEHCEQTVEEALDGISGVRDAKAEQATVDGDADPDALVATVEDAGYHATV